MACPEPGAITVLRAAHRKPGDEPTLHKDWALGIQGAS